MEFHPLQQIPIINEEYTGLLDSVIKGGGGLKMSYSMFRNPKGEEVSQVV